MSTDIGVWIAAILTLCIYSFLYKDNPFYKFAEHLFVGISAGYVIIIIFYLSFIPYAWKPLINAFKGQFSQFIVLIPIFLGLLFFTRFIPKYAWFVRWPIAFLFGVGAGIAIPAVMQANIFEQVHGNLRPFQEIRNGAFSWIDLFSASLVFVGVICTLIYFFFSVEHRGVIGGLSKVGIIFLMIGFGSAFGNTVMGRVALLIQRVYFLFHDWIHLVQ